MTPFRRTRTDAGWTLIELIVVLALIMVLSAVAVGSYRNSVVRAKEAALRSDLFMMRDAIDQYYADKQKYPDSLDALVSENYLRAVPKDPITDSTTTWTTVEADAPPGTTISASPGIYEVKSGSQAQSLDGTRYADW